MKTIDSARGHGANRSHTGWHGDDVQRHDGVEDALACLAILAMQYQGLGRVWRRRARRRPDLSQSRTRPCVEIVMPPARLVRHSIVNVGAALVLPARTLRALRSAGVQFVSAGPAGHCWPGARARVSRAPARAMTADAQKKSCKASAGCTTHAHPIAAAASSHLLQRPESKPTVLSQPHIKDIVMNRKNLLSLTAAVFAIVSAGSAIAGDGRGTSRHACTFQHGDRDYGAPCLPTTPSTLTREQVRAEAVAAVRAGLIHNDDHGLPAGRPFTSTLTRAQVKAETLEALRIGAVGGGDYALRDGPSAEQLESIRMAGQRALAMSLASR
jgi:Domain of unknown function (DUF4148)